MKLFAFAIISTLLLARQAEAYEFMTPERAVNDIGVENLWGTLQKFSSIAREHGGNRAQGQAGFNASMDYVLDRVVKRFGARLDTHVQEFNEVVHHVRGAIGVRGPDGQMVDSVAALQYVPATPLPGGVTGRLVDTPVDETRGSMCDAEQWRCLVEGEGGDGDGEGEKKTKTVRDAVVLIRRGGCAVATKLMLARRHGAAAVVLYEASDDDSGEGWRPRNATLGSKSRGSVVPAVVVAHEVGERWRALLAAASPEKRLTVTLVIDAVFEDRPGWNIISETKEGDPNRVVMLGAHLDSVAQGPGINDNGSGSAALLEIVESFQKYTGFRNKVRFAWWGAEENGLVGSLFYTSQLSEAERDKIKFYFNYDMMGSRQPMFGVLADDDTHKYGGGRLFEYLESVGMKPEYINFGRTSDYFGFLQMGVPSSGIFAGAGHPYDTCYHQPCDDLANIDWAGYEINAKAAAYAAAQLALTDLEAAPRRNASAAASRYARRSLLEDADGGGGGGGGGAAAAATIEKHASCGDEHLGYF